VRQLLTLCSILIAISYGCNQYQKPRSVQKEQTSIPSDVSFSIIKSDNIPGIKQSLDIRLNKKVSEQILRSIAYELKDQEPQPYDRTFIFYYLPGMSVGTGAWAITHFNPELNVEILGLTEQEDNHLRSQPVLDNREYVGRWLDDRYSMSKIVIFREGGILFLERTFKDGSSGKLEIVERNSTLGRYFEQVKQSTAGDHYIIIADGDLQIRDNDGLIATAKKIE